LLLIANTFDSIRVDSLRKLATTSNLPLVFNKATTTMMIVARQAILPAFLKNTILVYFSLILSLPLSLNVPLKLSPSHPIY
jgi:hypothetical protein